MRYLLDTNTFVFMALDPDSLSNDVLMALNEPDSLLYISAESVKELIVAYKKNHLTCHDGRHDSCFQRYPIPVLPTTGTKVAI